jgi:hypothetical protein
MAWVGLLGVVLGACGGSQGHPSDEPTSEPGVSEEEVTEEQVAEVMAEGSEFDEGFADRILKRGARKAEQCNQAGANDGEGSIEVVFDGTKGRVVDVTVGWEFDSSSEDGKKCIKNAFIGEIIPPFEGNRTVKYTITIPPVSKDEPKKDGDKGGKGGGK